MISDLFQLRRLGSDLRPSASADIAESRPPSLCSARARALEEFLATPVPVQPHFGNIASFCFCSGAIRLQREEDRSGGSRAGDHLRACKAFLPHVSHVNKEVEEESEQGGWDGMCTRGHVISKSEWIGVPALRRAHLLPPSFAPSLLAGWLAGCGLHTAANLHFQSWLISDGRKEEGGAEAGGEIVRSPHRRRCEHASSMGERATYLLRAEQWAEGRNMVAQGRWSFFENANAIGVSGRLGGQMEEA